MVVDSALGKESDILEAVVVLDNMVKVGVTFTTNIFKWLDFEAWFWRMFRAAFRINLAVIDDRFKPGKVFVVLSDNNLKIFRAPGDG